MIRTNLVIIILLACSACAQNSDSAKAFTIKPQPKPYTDMFLISEMSAMYRLTTIDDEPSRREYFFTGEIGLMKNLDHRHALGLGILTGYEADSWRVAIMPRFRRWFGESAHLDVSLGVTIFAKEGMKTSKLIGEFNFGIWHFFSLLAYIESYEKCFTRYNSLGQLQDITEKDVSLYGGLKFESYPGLALQGASIVVIALVLLTVSSADPFG